MEIVNGVLVRGIGELREQHIAESNSALTPLQQEAPVPHFTSALAGYILQQFQVNRDAKRNSGIEKEIFDSLRAYNGEYSAEDLQLIRQTGGSDIFINLTGVKARAAASWIRDIELPAKEAAWLVEPTPMPDLPQEIKDKIEAAVNQQFQQYLQPPSEQPQQPQQPQQQGQVLVQEQFPPNASQKQPQAPSQSMAQTIKEFNQAKRDIEDMVLAELNKIARHEMKKEERRIADQLAEGGWEKALSDFIDDFVVFPTAFLKGPIIAQDDALTYENGKPVPSKKFIFKNRRVSPFDMYPSPDAVSVNDANNIIEHIRMTRRELLGLRSLPSYRVEAIDNVLTQYSGSVYWLDTGIEQEKATSERRGTEYEANKDVIHGLHFFGSIEARLLKLWGIQDPEVLMAHDTAEFEVEAIVAGTHVIKCTRNRDPLRRRPFYKASYQTRPGSFWGRSLPGLVTDIQRVCNATVRALVNNMGLASGPQIEVYVDRLADNGAIGQIHPFKIWQLTSDPTGAGGRAINFTQPTSNAQELLKVYQEFEIRADDATGIPRYSYGNERVGGAAQTATGLSMLLESASKAIKDCVRNIDKEVIIPRIEYQFYWNIATDPHSTYTGDPKVIARGSSALTMRGAEQMRRNEFLQITANPVDQQIMGMAGRAELLRSVVGDLGLGEDLIPSRLELKELQEKNAQQAQQQQQMQMQLEQAKIETGLKATELQITGQERMHGQTQQLKQAEMLAKRELNSLQIQLAMARLEAERERNASANQTKLTGLQFSESEKSRRFDTEVALKLKRGEGI